MVTNNRSKYSNLIKKKASELGFMYCGIAKAEFLEEEAPRLEKWLNKNKQGQMQYMENYLDKRLDPRKLVDGAKSVISVLLNYFPDKQQNPDAPKISKYAYGKDYHYVLKDKLKNLLQYIQEEIGEVYGRAFVDSAPVLDKAWAKKAGLGWIGKHTNLIVKESGSFLFIGELIVDLELEYDNPYLQDYCGTCTACIDACPTDAISEPYIVDGSKCISYFTIELKSNEAIDDSMKGKFDNWTFGCDICQDVCPWNKFSKPHNEPAFTPLKEILNMNYKEWEEITEEVFKTAFKDSPLKRTKYEGIKRNLKFIRKHS